MQCDETGQRETFEILWRSLGEDRPQAINSSRERDRTAGCGPLGMVTNEQSAGIDVNPENRRATKAASRLGVNVANELHIMRAMGIDDT